MELWRKADLQRRHADSLLVFAAAGVIGGLFLGGGTNAEVRWFEATPCYILHITNCFEAGDEVVMDGCIMPNYKTVPVNATANIYDRIRANLDKHNNPTRMHRWRFNLRTGRTTEQRLDERILEFGMFNQRYATRPYRYAYSAVQVPGWFLFHGYVKHDLQTGQSWEIRLPEGQLDRRVEAPSRNRLGVSMRQGLP